MFKLSTVLLILAAVAVVMLGCDKSSGPQRNTVPVLSTTSVRAITETTAQSGGAIMSNGGATITARGVCWSTSETPTIDYYKTVDGAGTGSYTSSITGLISNTTYYVRAYATNSVGTGYGAVVSVTTNDPSGQAPEPVPGVATNIELMIYSYGYRALLDSMILPTEGEVVIDVFVANPFPDSSESYIVYARCDNYYTELYNCRQGETITVDLDSVGRCQQSMTGVIIKQTMFASDTYYADSSLTLFKTGFAMSITTDEQGRFGVGGLPTGDYSVQLVYEGATYVFDLINGEGTDYKDLSFIESEIAYAPNIYLYPETETQVAVTLSFPSGGHVSESEPPYNMGWNVSVKPDGIIDDTYEYLFYEAVLPGNFQTGTGWLLNTDELELEFRTLLSNLGFVGREIDDFVAHWVPLLDDAPYYGLFPQDMNSLIDLTIKPQPTSILRHLFLIRPFSGPVAIQTPPDDGPFIRDGFTVAEWGVIAPHLKHAGH